MRIAVVGAGSLIAWASYLTFRNNFHPLSPPHLVASAVLTSAATIQRVDSVHKWLASPKGKRKDQVNHFAQQTLINLCSNKEVGPDILGLTVHVWEVPLWYRRTFPYRVRKSLRKAVRGKGLRLFSRWLIRPSLVRVAAVGLVKPNPSGVRFCKGTGLVGVCVANNDRAEFVSLRTNDATYRRALKAANETEWQNYGLAITHNLTLQDARKLSHSYGQVMAHVVQDPATGEAIGCVTVSVEDANCPTLQITRNPEIKAKLIDLAMAVATVLA